MMKCLCVVVFCCFSVVSVKASEVLAVSGRVGGEVSIQCSGRWNTDGSSERNSIRYFCKGVCSRENILIQTERKRSAVTRQGRYSLVVDRRAGVFTVTIRELKQEDAGRYHCGVEKTFNALYQEVNLRVLDASTVPGPPTTLQSEAETLPRGSFPSSTDPSAAALTLPPSEEKRNQQKATNLTVVSVKASEVLAVSGRVGGEVSIQCSGRWNTDGSSERNSIRYFCKGVCSRENLLIQTERKRSAVTRQGRYSLVVDRRAGLFTVTIRELKQEDAGRYHCGVEKTFNALYQEVNLRVLDASTVPGPPTTLQSEAETLPRGSFPSSTDPSPAALTLPPSEEKRNQQKATPLTDTTVVIIVSGSLALLVCAIIPLIFYKHWRSNPGGESRTEENKGEGDHCEENADVASTQVAVGLQSFEPEVDAGATAHNTVQYAAIYQALDPTMLD